jgi:hypothetical protein
MTGPAFSPRVSIGNIITIITLVGGGILTFAELRDTVKADDLKIAGLEPRIKVLEDERKTIAERIARIEQSSIDNGGTLKHIEQLLTKR